MTSHQTEVPVGIASANRTSRGLSMALLVAGVTFSAFTEAVASTVLTFARLDMPGDIHATPDEFARLDVGYTAAKLTVFLLAPWLMSRLSAQTCLRAATGVMTLACGLAVFTTSLDLLLALRLFQGMAGAVLLVSGQTMLLQAFPRASQPLVQALYAIGAVVAPATLAPSMQGWLVESLSWSWIFLAVVPFGLMAVALLAVTDLGRDTEVGQTRLDWIGLFLLTVAVSCLTYVLNQGSRWDWFGEPFIVQMAGLGGLAVVLFLAWQVRMQGDGALLDFSVFRNEGFAFGFLASFAAGFALFGSSYLILSFAVSVLGMTVTGAGMLLLPSGAMFIASLLLTAFLVQKASFPPIATVPFGVVIFMIAMWMLSGSTGDSGSPDMMPAILFRGAGLGFLFLSITLITLVHLDRPLMAKGVGLFNVGRQTGGLLGVAFLETLLDHQSALNKAVLAAHMVPGRTALSEHLAMTAKSLMIRGLEAGAAGQAALGMLGRQIGAQATLIAYDTAFLTIALFFLAAAPVLVTAKVVISKALKPDRRPRRPKVWRSRQDSNLQPAD